MLVKLEGEGWAICLAEPVPLVPALAPAPAAEAALLVVATAAWGLRRRVGA